MVGPYSRPSGEGHCSRQEGRAIFHQQPSSYGGLRYNGLGEPIPGTIDEVALAFVELDWKPEEVEALIHQPDPNNIEPYLGWTADLCGPTGQISTAGFADPDRLTVGLTLLGVAELEFAA